MELGSSGLLSISAWLHLPDFISIATKWSCLPLLPKTIEAALLQSPPDPWLVYELELANTSKWAYAIQMYETGLELMEASKSAVCSSTVSGSPPSISCKRVNEYITDLVKLVEADPGALEVAALLLLCPFHRRR